MSLTLPPHTYGPPALGHPWPVMTNKAGFGDRRTDGQTLFQFRAGNLPSIQAHQKYE